MTPRKSDLKIKTRTKKKKKPSREHRDHTLQGIKNLGKLLNNNQKKEKKRVTRKLGVG